LVFTLTLSTAAAAPVSVAWSTVAGSARPGRDYVDGRGTVTFSPGQTRQTIGVWVIGDRLREGDEQFMVALAAPRNARLLDSTSRATGTIFDDDGAVRAAAFASLAATSPTGTAVKRVR
jgi:hypothetical protein